MLIFCYETRSCCNSNTGYANKSVPNAIWLIFRLLITVCHCSLHQQLHILYTNPIYHFPVLYWCDRSYSDVSYKPNGISSSPCNISPGPSSLFQCHFKFMQCSCKASGNAQLFVQAKTFLTLSLAHLGKFAFLSNIQ